MEVYGGPLLNSWLDREFGLAGRVVLSTGEQRLVATDPWLRIPQLAPHLDRSVNDGLILNPQRHLMPVYAVGVRSLKSWKTPRAGTSGTSGNSDFRPVVDTAGVDIIQALAEVLGCAADEIMGHDLFAYITQPPEYFGVDKQFLAAGRLDNLSSVYPGLQALIAAEPSIGTIPVLACFDHEEVGSETRTGAGGTLLDDVLTRICLGLSLTADEAYQVRARSQMVSADAGHSIHPNYPEKHDLDEHPLMGAGPMIKINAQQRYTSDGPGRQLWAAICAEAGVPHQVFVSNNAVPCGSTIGPIASTRLGIPTVDVGIPLLSMHSAREMCAPIDVEYLTQALTVFFIG
jgi:aspartyl aminopeptidase